MQSQWNIVKSRHYAPYELRVQAKDDTQYLWLIPFLFNRIEAMLSLPEEYHSTIEKTTDHAFSDDSYAGMLPVRRRSQSASSMRVIGDSFSVILPVRARSRGAPGMCVRKEQALNISGKPIFSLYEEISAQEYRVPGCRIIIPQTGIGDLHISGETVH